MSTSVSNSSSTSTDRRRPKFLSANTARRWITLAATLLVVLVGFFVIRTQGHVSGSEFAPSNFQTRSFTFYEIPLLHLQITPIRRTISSSTTSTYLRQKGLINVGKGAPSRWHLLALSRGLTGTTPADANLLSEQLTLKHGSDDFWRKWSIDHPSHAKILWPVVQKLAERELYVLLPALLERAAIVQDDTAQNVAGLQSVIDEYLQDEYARLIADMKEAGRTDLADELQKEAREDFPAKFDSGSTTKATASPS